MDVETGFYAVAPPYTEARPLPCAEWPATGMAGRGVLVAVRALPHEPWDALERRLCAALRHFHDAPLVLWTDLLGLDATAACASRARLLGVRAVAPRPLLRPPELRAQLTDWTGWPEAVAAWAGYRRPIGADAAAVIAGIAATVVTELGGSSGLGASAAAEPMPLSTRRGRLRRAGIGTPRAWHAALHATALGMLVQREPKTSLEALAFGLGLGSGAAVSNRCWDIIGARPTFIRERLGWQWMLLDGLRREGVRIGENDVD